jgi:hypothetical protein
MRRRSASSLHRLPATSSHRRHPSFSSPLRHKHSCLCTWVPLFFILRRGTACYGPCPHNPRANWSSRPPRGICFSSRLVRSQPRLRLLIQRAQHPFLQYISMLRLDLPKQYARPRGLTIKDRRLGLKIFPGIVNLHQNRAQHLKRPRSLQETPAQTQLCHSCWHKRMRRAPRRNLRARAERKPHSSTIFFLFHFPSLFHSISPVEPLDEPPSRIGYPLFPPCLGSSPLASYLLIPPLLPFFPPQM